MPKNLLIVESPAKAGTIKKYLGSDFNIMASVGHVKDLPVKTLGVDIENDFEPEYTTIKGKGKILKGLKEAAKESQRVYLAPDPDREGEAIAWHIARELKIDEDKVYRVLFNELTPGAISEAVASPQTLDRNKFNSQQARRILDRLVGYQVSPLLWKRVKRGLSAGRVQSVAVKMICDREREIHAFESKEYWSVTAHLNSGKPPFFDAKLFKLDGRKPKLKDEKSTLQVVSEIKDKPFRVVSVVKKKKKKNPYPPFTTSLLQQEASRRLGFSAKKTMMVAQGLYEGVELGDKGQVGLITYMRTDSFRVSKDALSEARGLIEETFGKDYLPAKPRVYKSRKGAQEAHEAIRPTSVSLEPDHVSRYLNKDQLSIYTLIWKRFVASQMNSAVLDQTQADIEAGRGVFRATGSVVVFNGFTVLYEEDRNDGSSGKDKDSRLPPLNEGMELTLLELEPAQHFTQPPPRYTEATLIKAMEENGIGRPSTYAAILANISGKEYVGTEKKRFYPTELGFLVTDLLEENFPDIMEISFTAQMEKSLDDIERGDVEWTRVMHDFYAAFKKDLDRAEGDMKGEIGAGLSCPECGRPLAVKSGKNGVFLACTGYPECSHTSNFTRDDRGKIVPDKVPDLGDETPTCDQCGRAMQVKSGKFGPFLACTGYPDCRNTLAVDPETGGIVKPEVSGKTCTECHGDMLIKTGRAGQRFLACERYPECTHTESYSIGISCPEEGCEGTIVEKGSRKGRKFYGCDRYPECRFAMWDEPNDDTCPECGTPVLAVKYPKNSSPVIACRKKGCRFKKPLPAS